MEIYYINTDEFLKTRDTDYLLRYAEGREFKSFKRFTQFAMGRFLVKTVAKKLYGLADTEIVIENDKPKFKNGGIFFSISHSGNFVAAAFDTAECGLDIEEMKQRDFEALSARYDREFHTAEDFYKFWTEYEAEIKLQQKAADSYSCVFRQNFMLTAVSGNKISDVTISPLDK